MASIGHVAVGMAAGRFHCRAAPTGKWPTMIVLAGLSLAPDLDVIAFVFRIPYEATWGHRGASHSIAIALLAGLIAAGIARLRRWPVPRTGLVVFLVVASHGLLDSLTTGGLGAALFWPLDDTRHFAPWRPIPVAPIGLGYLSRRGLNVAVTELVLFLPFFVYALWPARKPPAAR